MALIKCPECGKEISDKAPACIHCGYPLKKEAAAHSPAADNGSGSKCVIVPLKEISFHSVSEIVRITGEVLRSSPCAAQKRQMGKVNGPYYLAGRNLTDNEADQIRKNLDAAKISSSVFSEDDLPIMCPNCLSTDVSAGPRGFKLTTGFIGSGKTVITCLRCGHKWKPGK